MYERRPRGQLEKAIREHGGEPLGSGVPGMHAETEGPQPVVPLSLSVLYDRDNNPISFRNCYENQSCFLIGGGPSFLSQKVELLKQPGIVTATMNNAGAIFRSNFWFSVDDPSRFQSRIYCDSGIMKFIKTKYLAKRVSVWSGNDLVTLPNKLRECPNIWGYTHDKGFTTFHQNHFLDTQYPSWGSSAKENDVEGIEWHKSVMLVSIWLLYYLGFRRLYLLGCDFRMKVNKPYSFDEVQPKARCKGNNRLYGWLERQFVAMKNHFEAKGLVVKNCSPGSQLEAFPRMDMEDAIRYECGLLPQDTRTKGLYT